MLAFTIRRLLYGILVLWGVLTVVFLIFNLLPGDPARMMLGQRADKNAIDEINRELGLDKSLIAQYALYMNDVSPLSIHHHDANSHLFYSQEKYGGTTFNINKNYLIALKTPYLRTSYQTKSKVTNVLLSSLPETAILAIASILIALIIGLIFGLISALNRDSLLDKALLFFATCGMALPSFFVGILFAWLFGFVLSDFTGLNMTGSLYEVDDYGNGEYINWANLVLPAFTLGIRPLAVIIQLTRNAFLDVLSQDYIRTAKAKGLQRQTIIFKHSLKNAMNPIVTAVSGMFASLMAGAVFVEIIFSWKGIGWEIVNALENFDLPIVMGSVMIIASIFVLINLVVDILYGILDPKVRLE